MRRFFTRSLRFMDAYRKGLNGRQAAWAAKKYRGHRVIPETILRELSTANINWKFITELLHSLLLAVPLLSVFWHSLCRFWVPFCCWKQYRWWGGWKGGLSRWWLSRKGQFIDQHWSGMGTIYRFVYRSTLNALMDHMFWSHNCHSHVMLLKVHEPYLTIVSVLMQKMAFYFL